MPTVVEAQQRQQKAIVKTRGRLQNDGSVVEGRRIEDALVAIRNGAQVYSGANGELSFGVSQSEGFYIANITKTGYTLSDADVISKPHKYQSQPMDLLLESVDELRAYRRDIERKVRRNYQRQLDLAYDRIDSLESSSTANAEEIARLRAEIDRSYDLAEKYIEDMTERYLNIDFDRETDFDREISYYILNGELDRADSMLATRGDIVERVNQNLMAQKAVEQDREQVAKDCYHKYEIADQRHEREEAAKYLKLRASLDPHNIDWQIEAAKYISDILANYDEALSIYEPTLSYALEYYGENHANTAQLYNNIGSIYFDKGDYATASDYYQKALAIREKVLGSEDIAVASSYCSIGSIYLFFKSDYDIALDYHQKALVICEKVLGAEHSDVATIYNNIGFIYSEKEEYEKALDYYQKSLAIRKKVLDPEHPDVAFSYNNIGHIYKEKEDYDTALDYYLKALVIWKKVLGAEHPLVATCYNNIGAFYFDKGDYDKAIDFFQISLAIREKVFGEEHPDVANSYNNIGFIYSEKGEYEMALDYYHKSLAIREKTLGAEHSALATIYSNIGGIYDDKGDYDTALDYYQKSLAILEKVYGAEHTYVVKVRDRIEEIKSKL